MSDFQKYMIAMFCFMICALSGGILGIMHSSNKSADYREQLKTQGYIVETNVRIESPSITQYVDEQTFLEFAKGKIVYNPYGNTEFYTFNNDLTIAYCYRLPIW